MLDRFAKDKYDVAARLIDDIDGEEIRILLLEITVESSRLKDKISKSEETDTNYDVSKLKKLAESLLFRLVFDKSLTFEQKESAALVCAYAYETLSPKILTEFEITIDDHIFINRFIAALLYFIAGYDPNAEGIIGELTNSISLIETNNKIENQILIQLYNFSSLNMENTFCEVEAPKIPPFISATELEEYSRKACLWKLNLCLNDFSKEFLSTHTIWNENLSNDLKELYVLSKENNEETISLISLLLILFEEISKVRAISVLLPPVHLDLEIWQKHMQRYLDSKIYLIWPPHKLALEKGLLEKETNNIIAIPTGTGKSLIAEHKIISHLQMGSIIIYLAPTLALCRQIEKNMKKLMSVQHNGKGKSIINDEQVIFNKKSLEIEDAFILVMTPEKCVSLIANNEDIIKMCSLCVVDEFHNIFQGTRGALLDLLLSRISHLSETRFLIMSALIDDSPELIRWLENLNSKPVTIVDIKWRPARTLRGFISHPASEIRRGKKEGRKSGKKSYKTKIASQVNFCVQDVWHGDSREVFTVNLPIELEVRFKEKKDYKNEIYWTVEGYGNDIARQVGNYFASTNIPVLIFSQGTRHLLAEIEKHKKLHNPTHVLTDTTMAFLTLAAEELGFESELNNGLLHGIGIHTQAVILEEQAAVEEFFKKSNNGILCATGTISQGLNLAASVVIVNATKQHTEDGPKSLSKAEVINMLGRAGRPGFGQQSVGIVVPQYPATIHDELFQLDEISTSYLERVDGVEKTDSGLVNILREVAEKEINEEGVEDNFTLLTNTLGVANPILRKNLLRKTLATQFLETQELEVASDKWNLWSENSTLHDEELLLNAALKSAMKPSIVAVLLETINQEEIKDLLMDSSSDVYIIEWFFNCISRLSEDFIKENVDELLTNSEVMLEFFEGWIQGFSILELSKILNKHNIGKLNLENLNRSSQTSLAKAIKISKDGVRNISHISNAYLALLELLVLENVGQEINLPENYLYLPNYLRFGTSNKIALALRKSGFPRKSANKLSGFLPQDINIQEFLKTCKLNGEIEGINMEIGEAIIKILD